MSERRDDDQFNDPAPVVLGTPPATGSLFWRSAGRPRFNGVERAVHWLFGGLFLGLLASGLALFHPQWRNWDLAGLKVVKETHLTLGLLLVLAPLTAAAWDGWRSARYDLRALRWGATDWAWLGALARRLVGRPAAWPPQGRFNAGQKLNTVYLVGLSAGLVATGGLIWPDRLLAPGPRATLFALHDLLMLLSLPALIAHILLATVVPATRPSLRGMLDGRVPPAWYAAHHPLDPGPPPAPEPDGQGEERPGSRDA